MKKLEVAWDSLTAHRSELAETMVASAVEASSSEVQEIRQFATEIYFEMMKSEFESQDSLKTVETHTIDQVDQLTARFVGTDEKSNQIINRYLDFFRVSLKEKLQSGPKKLKQVGENFIGEIQRLYDYLVKLKQLPRDEFHEDERTSATLSLLDYLDQSGKDELYNR